MKKFLLTFSLAAFLLSAKSQVIITGYLHDPSSTDADATVAKEYIQLMATENIDFSVTNYAVVTCNNAGTLLPTGFPEAGWATGRERTYQFNLTSGTVAAGEFFYVGGDAKRLSGANTSLSMSASNWVVSRNYFSVQSDINVIERKGTTANMLANSGNPSGIAVFSGVNITTSSTPIDAVFYGGANGSIYQVSPELGYRIAENDFYSIANGEFFRKSSNTALVHSHTTGIIFVKLGGNYNKGTKTWDTKRSFTPITLSDASTLADIEGDGATALPVTMASFTAKANKQGTVNVVWATASEKNNSHFDVMRSVNGVDFNKIGEIKGAGNSDVVKKYSYTDANPSVGANYYRLKQVDFNGDFAYSQVAIAKVGLSNNSLTVSVANDKSSVAVNYNAITSGKAFFAIYNVTGAKLATVEKTVGVGNNQISIPVQLGNSIHVLSVSQAGATASTKF